MLTYDLEKRSYVTERKLGLMGQISFQRLSKVFAECGEIKPHETIRQFHVDDRGMIQFLVTEQVE